VTEVNGSGGCVLTLVSPANCATVNFGAGVVELAYTTNGRQLRAHRFERLE
jgi:hypothetical protein